MFFTLYIFKNQFVSVSGPRLSKVDAKLLKNGKPLQLKEVDVTVRDKEVHYLLKKPSRDQTGKFTVRMQNAAGQSNKDININMQDKPSAPQNVQVSLSFKNKKVSIIFIDLLTEILKKSFRTLENLYRQNH